VKWSALLVLLVPPGPVTVMSTVVPDVPAGDTAVIWFAELTEKLTAAVLPNFTAVAPVKPVPVMVTDEPPAAGPFDGETLLTVGTAFW
jgi:hypothetical protein